MNEAKIINELCHEYFQGEMKILHNKHPNYEATIEYIPALENENNWIKYGKSFMASLKKALDICVYLERCEDGGNHANSTMHSTFKDGMLYFPDGPEGHMRFKFHLADQLYKFELMVQQIKGGEDLTTLAESTPVELEEGLKEAIRKKPIGPYSKCYMFPGIFDKEVKTSGDGNDLELNICSNSQAGSSSGH